MDTVGSDDIVSGRSTLRSRWTRTSRRESLRMRVPQVATPEDDPDSSDDDEEDEDDDDDDTPDDGSRPIVTLTHAPPPQETTLASQIPSTRSTTQPSETTVIPSSEPTSLPSTTFLSVPSGTSATEASESAEGITATTTAGTTSITGDITATPDAEVGGDAASSGDSNRAADFGIIIGTLALAALLIGAGVFFYRRRSKGKGDPELARPSSRDSDRLGLISPPQMQEEHVALPGQRGLLHYSSWAQFDPRPSAQEPTSFYRGDDGSEVGGSLTDSPESLPSLPATVYQPHGREAEPVSPLDTPDSVAPGGRGEPYNDYPWSNDQRQTRDMRGFAR